MSQATNEDDDIVVQTTAAASLWEAICDGVNTVSSHGEAVFEFDPTDGLRTTVKDGANVCLIRQTVAPAAFDNWNVDTTYSFGMDTEKLADVLGVGADTTVTLQLNERSRKCEFRASGIEYDLAGIGPDAVNGSPVEIPDYGDGEKYDYSVWVDLPVAGWKRATDVIELTGSKFGDFVVPSDSDEVLIETSGDTDESRVKLSDDDGFAWADDRPTPDGRVVCTQSNNYMSELVGLWDTDTVRMVFGTELPYHVEAARHDGDIDTKVMQAPRVST